MKGNLRFHGDLIKEREINQKVVDVKLTLIVIDCYVFDHQGKKN